MKNRIKQQQVKPKHTCASAMSLSKISLAVAGAALLLATSNITVADTANRIVSSPLHITTSTPFIPPSASSTNLNQVTSCMGSAVAKYDIGTIYRNSEVEPVIKVNPTNPSNMVVAYQEDRVNNYGGGVGVGVKYTMDGGLTWTQASVPFTTCAGGKSNPQTQLATDFERASEPVAAFGPDGAAYVAVLSFNGDKNYNESWTIAKSTDGGVTWQGPYFIYLDPSNGYANSFDGGEILVDTNNSNILYFAGTNYAFSGNYGIPFSKSTDGGVTWSPAKNLTLYNPPFPTGANQILVPNHTRFTMLPSSTAHPNGILFAFTTVSTTDAATGGLIIYKQTINMMRSYDKGETWTPQAPIENQVISTQPNHEGYDYDRSVSFLTSFYDISVAADPNNGNVYAAWTDARFGGTNAFGATVPGAVMMVSSDGGDTWSASANVLPNTFLPTPPSGVQASIEKIAVAKDGRIGVLFYDMRHDVLGDATFDTDVYLTEFLPTGNKNHPFQFLTESRLTPTSFDASQFVTIEFAPYGSNYPFYHPGDYSGLDAAGNNFVASYAVANQNHTCPDDPTRMQPNCLFAPVYLGPMNIDSVDHQDIVFSKVSKPN